MKCSRCQVDKPEVEFIRNGKLHKQCNLCREKTNSSYKDSKLGVIPWSVSLKAKRKDALTRDMYVCSSCGEEKSLDNFCTNANSSKIFGYEGRCKSCKKFTGKFCKIKGQYGMSKGEFISKLESQGGKCKICKCHIETFSFENNKANTLCVDHCHDTGKVRGFLCNNCNRALGMFKDDAEILLSAYNYIVHFKSDELLEKPEEVNQQPS